MPGPFVHRIDPVIADVGGVCLWWYGLSYTLGLLGMHLWLLRSRHRLRMSRREVYSLSLCLIVGVLLGGRFVEVAFYEWDYYSKHPLQIPAYWLGGMATHGLLLGAVLGVLFYCWRRKRSFFEVADELVIPGAWVMGIGRLGNFIDGQISGAVTHVWWAVKFPDLAGFRHPVVLYDGLKNLLLIPFLLWVRRSSPPRGVVFAHFVLWYAFLRFFVDLFREYRVESFGLGIGQIINIAMSVVGLALLIWFHARGKAGAPAVAAASAQTDAGDEKPRWAARLALACLLLLCMVMPSDWTQDIPARYGQRHPGLRYSLLYPRIEERAPVRNAEEKKHAAPSQPIQDSGDAIPSPAAPESVERP